MNGEHKSAQDLMEEAQEQLWVDQLAANILLTVQAFQQLHTALDEKFTR